MMADERDRSVAPETVTLANWPWPSVLLRHTPSSPVSTVKFVTTTCRDESMSIPVFIFRQKKKKNKKREHKQKEEKSVMKTKLSYAEKGEEEEEERKQGKRKRQREIGFRCRAFLFPFEMKTASFGTDHRCWATGSRPTGAHCAQ